MIAFCRNLQPSFSKNHNAFLEKKLVAKNLL